MSIDRMVLGDGRVYEYVLSGDPAWPLLILHLGLPCAVTAFPHVSTAASRWNLRTAVCSRAGYGACTRQPGRTVADSAGDTGQLAHHLGAETFIVAGWSGGGPAALACAALLGDRVRACVTLAGTAPIAEAGDVWTAWYPDEDRRQIALLQARSADELADEYERVAGAFRDLTARAILDWPQNSESDLVALRTVPHAGESLAASMRRAAEGGVWGWLDDELAWARPWGFSMEQVSRPVVVRHGTSDRIVSIDHAQWLATHLPNARLDEIEGAGHTSVATPFEPVVESVLDVAAKGAAR